MKEKTYSSAAWIKFLAFSALGIIIFFININIGGSKNVPMLHIINIVKGKVPPNANMWLVTLICLFTLVTSLWARLPGAPQWIRNHHAKDNIFSYFTYITAAIFSLMVTLNVGPVFIIDPVVGASSINVARDVIYSVVIAGALVVFLTEFGLLEFIGTLMEPIMRKCFRVPGKSSIDALSSFVCSPAVEAIAQIMQLPSIQVIQVLDDLSRRGWIYEQEESGHLLLRDRFGLIETLLYERMPRYKRMELHRLALDYYELRRQQSSGDLFYLTQLCRHSSHTYNTQKKVYYHILHLERVLDYFDEFFPTIVDDTIQYNERWLISRSAPVISNHINKNTLLFRGCFCLSGTKMRRTENSS